MCECDLSEIAYLYVEYDKHWWWFDVVVVGCAGDSVRVCAAVSVYVSNNSGGYRYTTWIWVYANQYVMPNISKRYQQNVYFEQK